MMYIIYQMQMTPFETLVASTCSQHLQHPLTAFASHCLQNAMLKLSQQQMHHPGAPGLVNWPHLFYLTGQQWWHWALADLSVRIATLVSELVGTLQGQANCQYVYYTGRYICVQYLL